MSGIVKNVYDLRERIKEKHSGKDVGVEPHTFVMGNDLNDLYFKTVLSALKKGRVNYINSGSYEGSHRIEFDAATLMVNYPTTRPLAPTPRPGIPVSTNDEKIENYFNNYLINGNLQDTEHYTYGAWMWGIPEELPLESKRIQRGTRLNQLVWCLDHFIKKGLGTNHNYITIGCAEGLQRYDWPYEKGDEINRGTTECLRGITLRVLDEKQFNLHCFFRSWDLVAGLPENLGGLTRVMEFSIEYLNSNLPKDNAIIKPGRLYAYSPGLHVYEHDLDIAKLWTNLSEQKDEHLQNNI